MNRIIISGGPGSGKSTLLNTLGEMGYDSIPEASRELIRKQIASKSRCVPWQDLACFARLCLHKMIVDFQSAEVESMTFFDRGIPDIIAYLRTGGVEDEDSVYDAAKKYRYAADVFIAPPWEAIYINDAERWQTFEEASVLHRTIRAVYIELGYKIIELPMVKVAERAEFLLTKIKELETN